MLRPLVTRWGQEFIVRCARIAGVRILLRRIKE